MAVDPNTLLAEAKCYTCLGITLFEALQLAMLARIYQNGASGGGGNQITQGLVDPVAPPVDPTKPALYTNLDTGALWTWNTDDQVWQ